MEEKEGLNGGTVPKKLDSGMVEELQELLSPFQSGQKRPTAEQTSETHRLDEQKIRAALLVWLQRHYQSGELSLEEAAQLILCEREFPCASPEEESWAEELTADVLQHIARSRERKAKGKNPALCARVQVILERQFETITLKMAAEMVGVNSSYLSRTVSQTYGCSFLDLLHCRRILAAVERFGAPEPRDSMEAISLQVGYTTVHHFYCVFRRYIGSPPKEMRTLIRIMTHA